MSDGVLTEKSWFKIGDLGTSWASNYQVDFCRQKNFDRHF